MRQTHNHHFVVLIAAGLLVAAAVPFFTEIVSNAVQTSGTLKVTIAQRATLDVTFTPLPAIIGQTLTFTATGYDADNIARITIYIDGKAVKKCDYYASSTKPVEGIATDKKNQRCTHSTSYSSGSSHTYYAKMLDYKSNSINSPTTGVKAFTIKDNVNPTLSVNTIPGPGNLTIVANVKDETELFSARIFVDGKEAKVCDLKKLTTSICSYGSSFATGTHNYYVTVIDNARNSARVPASGTNSFTTP